MRSAPAKVVADRLGRQDEWWGLHAPSGPAHAPLDETGSDDHRAEFERVHPDTVRELREAETKRRERKQGGAVEAEGQGQLDFEDAEESYKDLMARLSRQT